MQISHEEQTSEEQSIKQENVGEGKGGARKYCGEGEGGARKHCGQGGRKREKPLWVRGKEAREFHSAAADRGAAAEHRRGPRHPCIERRVAQRSAGERRATWSRAHNTHL